MTDARPRRGRPRAAPPPTPLARAIRHWRERRDLTQTELADALQVGVRTVQEWEAGTLEPRASKLLDLARQLDVGVSDLLEGAPEG